MMKGLKMLLGLLVFSLVMVDEGTKAEDIDLEDSDGDGINDDEDDDDDNDGIPDSGGYLIKWNYLIFDTNFRG